MSRPLSEQEIAALGELVFAIRKNAGVAAHLARVHKNKGTIEDKCAGIEQLATELFELAKR